MTINNNKTKNNFYLIQEFLKNNLKCILIKPQRYNKYKIYNSRRC